MFARRSQSAADVDRTADSDSIGLLLIGVPVVPWRAEAARRRAATSSTRLLVGERAGRFCHRRRDLRRHRLSDLEYRFGRRGTGDLATTATAFLLRPPPYRLMTAPVTVMTPEKCDSIVARRYSGRSADRVAVTSQAGLVADIRTADLRAGPTAAWRSRCASHSERTVLGFPAPHRLRLIELMGVPDQAPDLGAGRKNPGRR